MRTGTEIAAEVLDQVRMLAAGCGHPDAEVAPDDCLPDTGLLDSAAIIELVTWVELHYDILIPTEDIVIETLGSVRSIAAYVSARLAA
ncbi:MAG: acyl carrier protein [Magnetospirillum sp.]|nr:MAG: acyl carrier protein [Magnetospirillum sp.]